MQEFEHLQVVALNHQVLGGVPVHALARAGAQGAGAGGQRNLPGAAFAVPVESILFLPLIDLPAQQLLEHLKVNTAFFKCLGEQGFELGQVIFNDVGALGIGWD